MAWVAAPWRKHDLPEMRTILLAAILRRSQCSVRAIEGPQTRARAARFMACSLPLPPPIVQKRLGCFLSIRDQPPKIIHPLPHPGGFTTRLENRSPTLQICIFAGFSLGERFSKRVLDPQGRGRARIFGGEGCMSPYFGPTPVRQSFAGGPPRRALERPP